MDVYIILRHLKAHLTAFNQDTSTFLRSTWTREREADVWQPD